MATEEEVAPNEEEEIIDFEELRKMKVHQNTYMILKSVTLLMSLFSKVADLKAKLTELGLPSKGTKQELITRLEEYYTSQGKLGIVLNEFSRRCEFKLNHNYHIPIMHVPQQELKFSVFFLDFEVPGYILL